jgi:hypothetical protein
VPFKRQTVNCSGVSCWRHSSSDLVIFSPMGDAPLAVTVLLRTALHNSDDV